MRDRYSAYIFDLDGTLFRGEAPIPGAAEALSVLRDRGAKIRFLTNNSTRTREFYADKLRRLGFEADADEVVGSGFGTAKFLLDRQVRRVHVVGEDGLRETLRIEGIEVVDADPEAVVVGLSKAFCYDDLNRAMQMIRRGALFVATNVDATYPVEDGEFIPGAGSVVAAIRTCAEVEPIVVGKPNPYLVEMLLADLELPAVDVLVVGDRMDTDIESGKRAGCDTCLVLTGAAHEAPPGQAWRQDVSKLV